jgi:hypothetical protein
MGSFFNFDVSFSDIHGQKNDVSESDVRLQFLDGSALILEFHPDMVGERVAFFVSDLSQDGNGFVVRSSAESAEAGAIRMLRKRCSKIPHKMSSLFLSQEGFSRLRLQM